MRGRRLAVISQGFAKLTSNFGPIWFHQGDNISVWEAIVMMVSAFGFMAAALAFFRWWSE